MKPTTTPARTRTAHPTKAPGLFVALLVAVAAVAVNRAAPTVSALLITIVAGALFANLAPGGVPARLAPGLAFAAKPLLRVGIVLLGLQVALGDIAGLGWPVVVGAVAVVVGGIAFTIVLGRLMRIGATQTLLIACGFSICGAAAVCGVDGVLGDRRKSEETATAIALVVVFGSLMIALMPALARVFGLSPEFAGIWTGASVHEVAQVVAAGALIGGPALKVAVIVKLARVLMLAPVLAGVSWWLRRTAVAGQADGDVQRPPLVPLFVLGFIAMVLVRTTGVLPAEVLDVAKLVQTTLLSAAMFALGCSVHWTVLRRAGGKVVVLAAAATAMVLTLGLATAFAA